MQVKNTFLLVLFFAVRSFVAATLSLNVVLHAFYQMRFCVVYVRASVKRRGGAVRCLQMSLSRTVTRPP